MCVFFPKWETSCFVTQILFEEKLFLEKYVPWKIGEIRFLWWSIAVKDTRILDYRSSKEVVHFKINTKSIHERVLPEQLISWSGYFPPHVNLTVHYLLHNSPPLDPNLEPDEFILQPYRNLLTVHFNIILPPTCSTREWSHSFMYSHKRNLVWSVISVFRRNADKICALLGYNAASNGKPLPTFRDNVSVPSSRVMGPIRCPETSVKDYHSTLRYTPEGRRSQIFYEFKLDMIQKLQECSWF
jgi:hypothetical protein